MHSYSCYIRYSDVSQARVYSIEGIVESWNYSDEERLEERSISIKDDTGQEKSVIVYSTGIHQGEHLVVEYLPHSKYGIVKERIR